ncbi:SDR family NAD(P)-dependent oxidoreductase [Cyanobium sp. NIES-981]|uniref:SDR family NAD(P)-dependent oxidoreductase n=1 Tax=Cyanobium sp. NIES-981 TaxID=1851505 RepID=UPI0007DDC886|nr:SDR family NAD(P)-dependent oxidoreductase [Cyanobium sp. NIES-981]SBO42281.1 Cell-cell signaling protein, C-factor [Cyanobium sp. NIES-981]
MTATHPPLSSWQGRALVVGSGGIGAGLLRALSTRAPALELVATTRRQPPPGEEVRWLRLDVTCDTSLDRLGRELAQGPPLRLVINTVGLLHGPELQPEKRLAQLRRSALERSFAVNAFAPVLLAQALEAALSRQSPFHFASLSARVGSIGDNGLGGWYSYRAAKAAQNQLLRTLALEWRRRYPLACVSLLHPGTTATALSAPFQANVPAGSLFSPGRAAHHLLDVLEGLGPEQSGGFWAWNGERIPW